MSFQGKEQMLYLKGKKYKHTHRGRDLSEYISYVEKEHIYETNAIQRDPYIKNKS